MEDGVGRGHLRGVRTVLYMLAVSIAVVVVVILFSYCHVQRVCHAVCSHTTRRLPLQSVFSISFVQEACDDLLTLIVDAVSGQLHFVCRLATWQEAVYDVG